MVYEFFFWVWRKFFTQTLNSKENKFEKMRHETCPFYPHTFLDLERVMRSYLHQKSIFLLGTETTCTLHNPDRMKMYLLKLGKSTASIRRIQHLSETRTMLGKVNINRIAHLSFLFSQLTSSTTITRLHSDKNKIFPRLHMQTTTLSLHVLSGFAIFV